MKKIFLLIGLVSVAVVPLAHGSTTYKVVANDQNNITVNSIPADTTDLLLYAYDEGKVTVTCSIPSSVTNIFMTVWNNSTISVKNNIPSQVNVFVQQKYSALIHYFGGTDVTQGRKQTLKKWLSKQQQTIPYLVNIANKYKASHPETNQDNGIFNGFDTVEYLINNLSWLGNHSRSLNIQELIFLMPYTLWELYNYSPTLPSASENSNSVR